MIHRHPVASSLLQVITLYLFVYHSPILLVCCLLSFILKIIINYNLHATVYYIVLAHPVFVADGRRDGDIVKDRDRDYHSMVLQRFSCSVNCRIKSLGHVLYLCRTDEETI